MLVPTAIDSLCADPSASGWFLLATAVAADAGTLPEQQSSHKTQAADGLWHRHRHSIPSGCLPVTAPTSKPLPRAPSNGSQAPACPSEHFRPSNAVAVKGAEIDLSESLYHASMTPQHIVETALGFDDNISKRSLWAFACSVLTADAHRTRAATAANRNGDEPSSASALSAQRSSTHNIDAGARADAGGGVDANGFSPLSASASDKSAASSMPHRTSAAAAAAAASGTAAFSPIACFSRMDFNDHQASLFGDLLFDIGAAEPATTNANPSGVAIPDQAEELRPPTVKEDMNGDNAAGRMIPHPPSGSPAAQRPRPIVANDASPSTSFPAERRGSGRGNMTREPTSTAGEALSGSESNCLADLSPLQSFALDMMVAGSQSGAISGSDWAKIGGALQVAGAAPKLNGSPNHRTPNQNLSPGHPSLAQSNGRRHSSEAGMCRSTGGKTTARPLCVAGCEVPIVLVFDFAFRDAPPSLEHFKEIIAKDQHNETATGDASPLELLSPSQQHLRSPTSDNASGSPGSSWQGLRQQVLAGSCRRKPVLSDGDDDGKKASNSHKRDGNTESGFGEPPLAQTQRDGAEGSTATFDLEPLSSFSEDSFDDGLDSDFQLDMSGNGDSPYGVRTPRGPLELSGVGAALGHSGVGGTFGASGTGDRRRERPDIIVQRLQEELDERSMADDSVDEWADMNNGEAEETTLMARRLDDIRSQLTGRSGRSTHSSHSA